MFEKLTLISQREKNMRIIKRLFITSLIAVIVTSAPQNVLAQPVDPCTDPADPCPIDSNLIVLFAAAIAVAAKKTYDYKRVSITK